MLVDDGLLGVAARQSAVTVGCLELDSMTFAGLEAVSHYLVIAEDGANDA